MSEYMSFMVSSQRKEERYLLDTNVISELRLVPLKRADKKFTDWLATVDASAFFTSPIVFLEIEKGILSKERRDPEQGRIFRQWFELDIRPGFAGRVLPVTGDIALHCARLHVPNPRPYYDALIAATAIVHDMILVTRNVKDFAGLGIQVSNPFV